MPSCGILAYIRQRNVSTFARPTITCHPPPYSFTKHPPLLTIAFLCKLWGKATFFDNDMFTAFHNVIIHVCILTAILIVNTGNDNDRSIVIPPRDVLEDIITDFLTMAQWANSTNAYAEPYDSPHRPEPGTRLDQILADLKARLRKHLITFPDRPFGEFTR